MVDLSIASRVRLIVGGLSTILTSAALLASAFNASPAGADDWPQWRGPQRDGVWRETGVVGKFAGPELKQRWNVPIGSGYSGPTVAAGRVYVTDRQVEPKEIERVICLDAASGKELWKHAYDCHYVSVGYTAGPRASVTIDDGRAFSLGTMGNLFAFDAASGKILWSHDLLTEFDVQMPMWGLATSPLIDGDLVIVEAGGKHACLMAFDKRSGAVRWQALDDRASYSSPILVQQAGQKVLVCWTGDNVVGLNPQTGAIYWEHPFVPTRMPIGITTPVVADDRLFVSSFYDGSLLLKLDPGQLKVSEVWRKLGPDEQHTVSLHAMIGTPWMLGNYIYGVDSYGELRCLERDTGERVWESLAAVPKARWATIHMVRNGDRMWMLNERGMLIIAKLSSSGYEEISRAKLIDPTREQLPQRGGVVWSHPAFAEKQIFARNDERLVCASLAEGEN